MKVTITISEDGRVSIEGPLQNKMLMYGILGVAKDAVRAYDPRGIIVPQPTVNG